MKTIKIVIEKSKDAFWAYAENFEGINGVGDTVEQVKNSVVEAVAIQKELGNLKKDNYQIVFHFDTESLLNYYKGIFTNAAFEKLTGINKRQIQHYASGLKKPRAIQRKKIESSLHKLGAELMALEL